MSDMGELAASAANLVDAFFGLCAAALSVAAFCLAYGVDDRLKKAEKEIERIDRHFYGVSDGADDAHEEEGGC